MKPIPDVGKTYKFYDDGKVTLSRQYEAKVLRLVSPEEAKEIVFPTYYNRYNEETTTIVVKDDDPNGLKSLYDCWRDQVKEHTQHEGGCIFTKMTKDGHIKSLEVGDPWLYANDTDWFIECEIPEYEPEYTVWFVRTIDGGWFSMDIQNCWMSGELDVTNKMTEWLEKVKSQI